MDRVIKEIVDSMTKNGNYVDVKNKIDGKVCLDGYFTPEELLRLGVALTREKGIDVVVGAGEPKDE